MTDKMLLGRYGPAEVRLGLEARDLPGGILDIVRLAGARIIWSAQRLLSAVFEPEACSEDRPMRVLAPITIAIMLTVGATQARSHQAPSGWDYPFECCSEADCARIDPGVVRETRSGFVVTIAPGRHPMWPTERREPLVLDIPHQKARQSPDGFWHLCINDAGELLCFYSPGGDS